LREGRVEDGGCFGVVEMCRIDMVDLTALGEGAIDFWILKADLWSFIEYNTCGIVPGQ